MRLHARLLACGVMPACKQSGKCTQMLSDREESLLGEGLPWAVPVGVMTILTNCRKFLMGVHRLAVLSKMSSPTLPCGGRRCVPLRFRWHCCGDGCRGREQPFSLCETCGLTLCAECVEEGRHALPAQRHARLVRAPLSLQPIPSAIGAADAHPSAVRLPSAIMPGGSLHCGGDLLLTNLFVQVEGGTRMVSVVMPAGAVVAFDARTLAHGTLEHHRRRCRTSAAHLSFAVQTPQAVLGLPPAGGAERHAQLLRTARLDMEAHWNGATRVEVFVGDPSPMPSEHLFHDPLTMYSLPYAKMVLVDASSGSPVLFYDSTGGMEKNLRSIVRERYDFLAEYQFSNLDRHKCHSLCHGVLSLDSAKGQRMVMGGLRSQTRNRRRPAAKRRKWLKTAVPDGDLDAYVEQFDDVRFAHDDLLAVLNGMSACMHKLLPQHSSNMCEMLEKARVCERVVTESSMQFVSSDLLVNNYGVSAAYQSPAHVDPSDVGFTFAFAVKCD
jgi:hypothetical protein